jgi:hypothetical protein
MDATYYLSLYLLKDKIVFNISCEQNHLGGITEDPNVYTSTTWIYNIASNTW